MISLLNIGIFLPGSAGWQGMWSLVRIAPHNPR